MKEGRGKVYFPSLMRDHWAAKQKTQETPLEVTRMWERGMTAGARAGKLIGAGGGGFMLFYVDIETQSDVRNAMAAYREVPLKSGSGVTYWEI
jgi:D-glycero-alpha-D-manno-heptose-7-phosphate kinase